MALTPFKATIGRVTASSREDSSRAFYERRASNDMKGILDDFYAFCAHIENMSSTVVYEALKPTFEKTQERVPVDTGDLKGSGYLEITGKGQVQMGYGRGGFPEYTPIVHEDMAMKHKAPTAAKFLQGPLEEDYFTIVGRIAQLTKKAAGMS